MVQNMQMCSDGVAQHICFTTSVCVQSCAQVFDTGSSVTFLQGFRSSEVETSNAGSALSPFSSCSDGGTPAESNTGTADGRSSKAAVEGLPPVCEIRRFMSEILQGLQVLCSPLMFRVRPMYRSSFPSGSLCSQLYCPQLPKCSAMQIISVSAGGA